MARFEVQLANGQSYLVDAPPGATEAQIVAAAARRAESEQVQEFVTEYNERGEVVAKHPIYRVPFDLQAGASVRALPPQQSWDAAQLQTTESSNLPSGHTRTGGEMSDSDQAFTALVKGAVVGGSLVVFLFICLVTWKVAKRVGKTGMDVGKRVVDQTKDRLGGIPDSSAGSDSHYVAAYQEATVGNPDPVAWAKAFAHAEGNQEKARALYVKYRVDQLKRLQTA
jgi:hypothetical protein